MEDKRTSILINTSLDNNGFNDFNDNTLLNPFDVITIRRLPGYKLPESVLISGQVQYPGPYTLSSSNDKVSDVLKRAGGLANDAFPEGAYLKRFKSEIEKSTAMETVKKLQNNAKDSTGSVSNEILREFDKIPLNLVAILQKPGSNEDILLKEKDELFIPKYDAQVRVSGEVLLSTQIPFTSNNSLGEYIKAAGGYTTNAQKSKVYVVYANGKASATSHFLFFKKYPVVQPGSEIIIPKKREKKATGLSEIVGLTTIIASLVTTYVLLKK